MAKSTTDTKAASTKVSTQKAVRKARGDGDQVSVALPSTVWKVLHATSKLQGTRISVLLAQSLGPILSNAGVTVEEVEKYLKGGQKPQPQKEVRSEVLDRLFGASVVG